MSIPGSHTLLPQEFYHLRVRDRKAWLYLCGTLPRNGGFLGHPSKQLATLLAGVLSLRFKFGGTDGARTRGLLRDRQAFSPSKLQLRFVLTDQQRQPNQVSDVYQASFSQSQ